MQDFHYKPSPVDVYFGLGASAEVKDLLFKQGYRRVLVITTPGQEKVGHNLLNNLNDIAIGVYPHAVMHVPVEIADKPRA